MNQDFEFDPYKDYSMNFYGSTIKTFIVGLELYSKYLSKYLHEGNEKMQERYDGILRCVKWLQNKLETDFTSDHDIESILISGKLLSIIKSSLFYLKTDYIKEKKKQEGNGVPKDALEYLEKKIESIDSVLNIEVISRIPEEFIMGTIEEVSIPEIPSIENIINESESSKLEFKSSLSWDYKLSTVNKELELVVIESISGFLNSNGGILIIGIDDEKKILGLQKDYNLLKKGDKRDAFQLKLTGLINTHLGKSVHVYIKIDFESVSDEDICLIRIGASDSPIYFTIGNNKEFYIRAHASKERLKIDEAISYIQKHWK